MSSQTISIAQETAQQEEPDRYKIYDAAAHGNIKFFKDHESEICNFVSHTKNTVLHIYIIAQSKGREDRRTFWFAMPSGVFANCKKMICCPRESKEDEAELMQARAGEAVLAMLDICPALLEKANDSGDTPLHMAARHGQVGIVKALIDRLKNAEKDLEKGVHTMLHTVNADEETALHQAVRYKHDKVVSLLVEEDDKNFEHLPNKDGETPLYMAAERGDGRSVKKIVDHYTSPAYGGPDGRTALHAAALHSLHDGARDKVASLKDLTTKRDDLGRTPLHYNSYFIDFDKSAAFITDNDGKTAAHLLAGKGRSLMVTNLIEKCPECFELVDHRGRNALHYAVESGDGHTVDAILRSEYLGDLLKKKDNDGVTPLHLLAASRIYMPNLIKDPRVDKMAFNREKLTPVDIISSNPTNSRTEMELENSMREAGIDPGKRLKHSETNKINIHIDEVHNKKGNAKETDHIINKNVNDDDHDDLKEERQNHLVVAALIATVTFAAGFTLPGGFDQEKGPNLGYAVLTKKTAFQAFVITNTLAMVLSCAAVFIHLLIAMNKKKENMTEEVVGKEKPQTKKEKMIAKFKEKTKVLELFNKALPITLMAIVAMVTAFITGSYSVLSHAPGLAIAALVTGCLFFGLFWYLWEELFTESKAILILMIMIVVCLLWIIMGTIITCVIVIPLCIVLLCLPTRRGREFRRDFIHMCS